MKNSVVMTIRLPNELNTKLNLLKINKSEVCRLALMETILKHDYFQQLSDFDGKLQVLK